MDLLEEKSVSEYNGVPHYKNLDLESLPGEMWAPIKGFEGLYEISELGRVKSLYRFRNDRGALKKIKEKILKPIVLSTGYVKVGLSLNGISYPCTIHYLVASCFLPNPLNLPEVNHKYGNKKDNRKTVLEWITQYDNILHAKRTGLDKAIAETHYHTKFTNLKVIDIFYSKEKISDIANKYRVSYQCIWNIKKRKWWKSITDNL